MASPSSSPRSTFAEYTAELRRHNRAVWRGDERPAWARSTAVSRLVSVLHAGLIVFGAWAGAAWTFPAMGAFGSALAGGDPRVLAVSAAAFDLSDRLGLHKVLALVAVGVTAAVLIGVVVGNYLVTLRWDLTAASGADRVVTAESRP